MASASWNFHVGTAGSTRASTPWETRRVLLLSAGIRNTDLSVASVVLGSSHCVQNAFQACPHPWGCSPAGHKRVAYSVLGRRQFGG